MASTFTRFVRKVATWVWCLIHLPRIYTIADSTKSRLASCERLIEGVIGRLDHLEQRLTSVEQRVIGLEQGAQSFFGFASPARDQEPPA
jgi:hypothetical protein